MVETGFLLPHRKRTHIHTEAEISDLRDYLLASNQAVDSAKLGGQLPAYYAVEALSLQKTGGDMTGEIYKHIQSLNIDSVYVPTVGSNVINITTGSYDNSFDGLDHVIVVYLTMNLVDDGLDAGYGTGITRLSYTIDGGPVRTHDFLDTLSVGGAVDTAIWNIPDYDIGLRLSGTPGDGSGDQVTINITGGIDHVFYHAGNVPNFLNKDSGGIINGNVTIVGNLDIVGPRTIKLGETVEIEDNIFLLNSNITAYSGNLDAGLEVKLFTSGEAADNRSFIFSISKDGWYTADTIEVEHVVVGGGSNSRGLIASGSLYDYISPESHSGHMWIRNDDSTFTFMGGVTADDWSLTYQMYLPVSPTTDNAQYMELGQRKSNATEGVYGGTRIVKTVANTVVDGDLKVANIISSGGLTIGGSIDSGGLGSTSNYISNATNIILKGDSVGRSAIFFESEKDGTNINHTSDYGFIQFHAYGQAGTSGETNELIIGVSNDPGDSVVLNVPSDNDIKVRIGAEAKALDKVIYHEGNLNFALVGNTLTITVNT